MAWDYTNDYSSTISAYTSGAGSITVVSVTGLPASGKYFILKVDDEYFLCTSYTGFVLTVTGGQAGSTPANHSLGTAITGCWIVPQVLDGIKSDIIAAAGLVLLEQHTASNSAELDFTAWYSSLYDVYEIHIIGLKPVSNADIGFQFSTDGGASYDSGANYSMISNYAYTGAPGAVGESGGGGKTAAWFFNGSATIASYGSIEGRIYLHHPGSTSLYKQLLGRISTYWGSSPYVQITSWQGVYLSIGAANSFKIIASTGNIASGTVRIYGVTK